LFLAVTVVTMGVILCAMAGWFTVGLAIQKGTANPEAKPSAALPSPPCSLDTVADTYAALGNWVGLATAPRTDATYWRTSFDRYLDSIGFTRTTPAWVTLIDLDGKEYGGTIRQRTLVHESGHDYIQWFTVTLHFQPPLLKDEALHAVRIGVSPTPTGTPIPVGTTKVWAHYDDEIVVTPKAAIEYARAY
jgi:hypothetical protein